MINEETIQFLRLLETNNNREWFNDNKKKFTEAQQNFSDFVQQLIDKVVIWYPSVNGLAPKQCQFRIYRDTRFSKNKLPYKTNFGAAIATNGRKTAEAGFYFHLKPGGESFLCGGRWMPTPAHLKAIRQEIDYNLEEFRGIVESKNFNKYFDKLYGEEVKTAPKGYKKDHVGIEFIKKKSFLGMYKLKDADLVKGNLLNKIDDVFQQALPLVNFLNRAVDGVEP